MTYRGRGRETQALSPTSLSIARGEFVSLVGPSGCGKTTLLRAIAGLLKPGTGRVTVEGRDVDAPQTDMGIVFQTPILLEWFSVLRNVTFPAGARGMDRALAEQRGRELLRKVGLAGFELARPSQLSGGMQQRVALCRALLHDPAVILMDEPFGALDAITRDQMCLDLQKFWTAGERTVLFVTHDIGEAVFLSDRVLVMAPSPGRIEREFTIDLPRPRRLATRDTDGFVRACKSIRRAFEAQGILHDD